MIHGLNLLIVLDLQFRKSNRYKPLMIIPFEEKEGKDGSRGGQKKRWYQKIIIYSEFS